MASAVEPRRERNRKYWRWTGYVNGALLLVLASIPTEEDRDEGGAHAAGAFVGALVVPLAIAFVLRLVYVKLIRRDGRPVWSPWLVFTAGIIAILARAGRLSQDN